MAKDLNVLTHLRNQWDGPKVVSDPGFFGPPIPADPPWDQKKQVVDGRTLWLSTVRKPK